MNPQDLIDRRLMRCRCRHSVNRHVAQVSTHQLIGGVYPVVTGTACARCKCQHFSARPAPWRVTRESVHASTIPIAGPWRVTSPRGVTLHRTWSQSAAIELARHMAGVDEMLARVNRLERNQFGPTPVGSARPGTPTVDDVMAEARNGDVITYEGPRRVLRRMAGLPEVTG